MRATSKTIDASMTPSNHTNFKSHFEELLRYALSTLSAKDLDINIEFARPKQVNHGDYSCNLAMQLAKPLRKNPRDIALQLINKMKSIYNFFFHTIWRIPIF